MKLLNRFRRPATRPTNRARLDLENLDHRIVPATLTWAGSILQETSDGTDGANWVGGVAPAAYDDIVIPKNTGGIVWNTAVVGSVTIENGWFGLWAGNSLTIGGDSTLQSATFSMNAPLTIESGATVTADSVKFQEQNPGNATLVVEALGKLNLKGINTIATRVDNLGTVTLTAQAIGLTLDKGIEFKNRGDLKFAGPSIVTATTGDEFITNTGFLNLTTANFVQIEPWVNNTGVVTISAAKGGFLTFSSSHAGSSLQNSGSGIIKLPDGNNMAFNGAGLHSMGGEFQTIDNPAANLPAASTRGNMWLENTLVTIGYGGTSGKHYLFSRGGNVVFDHSTLNVTLNHTNDSVDRWQLDGEITFAGPNTPNTLNLAQIAPPATPPVNKWWTVVEAVTVTNDFEGWGIGDLSHRKITAGVTDIQVGYPAAPAPKPPLAYVSPSSTYPTVVWVSNMMNPTAPPVAFTYNPTFVYNPADPNAPQVVLVTDMMNPMTPPRVYTANLTYVSNPMDPYVGYVWYTPPMTPPPMVNPLPPEMLTYWYELNMPPIVVPPTVPPVMPPVIPPTVPPVTPPIDPLDPYYIPV